MARLMRGLILTVALAACTLAYDDYTVFTEPTTYDPWFSTSEQDTIGMIQCYDSSRREHVLAKHCAINYQSKSMYSCERSGSVVEYTALNGTSAEDVCVRDFGSVKIVCSTNRCTENREALEQAVRDGLNVHINGIEYSSSEECKNEIIKTLPLGDSTGPPVPPRLPETTTNLPPTSTPPHTPCVVGEYGTMYNIIFIWDASYHTYINSGNESLAAQALFANEIIDVFGDFGAYQISAIGGQTIDGNCRYSSDTGKNERIGRKKVVSTVEYYEEMFNEWPEEFEFAIPACAINPPLKRMMSTRKDRKTIIFNFETDERQIKYRQDTTYNFVLDFAGQKARDLDELREAGATVVSITSSLDTTYVNPDKLFLISEINAENVNANWTWQTLTDGCFD